MHIPGLLCVAAYCFAAFIVGTRLLRLARRTRELPELMIGCSFLSGGTLGYPASIASQLLAPDSPAVAWPVAGLGSMGLSVASACVLVAWWRIYQPLKPWGRWAVVLWTLLLIQVFVLELSRSAAELAPGASPWEPLRVIAQGVPYAAMAWSGFRYHARLRRRMRVLRTDPVVANRILLWNVAATCVTLQYLFYLAYPYIDRFYDAGAAAPAYNGILGLIIAICISCAFYPLPTYLRRIRKRAGLESG
jgi:hypothetical protein